MRADIVNGRIVCPHCQTIVNVKRAYGTGATYVDDWTRLPPKIIKILSIWLDPANYQFRHTKRQIDAFLRSAGLHLSPAAFGGRMSELVGLGLVSMQIYNDTQYHNTVKAPTYVLDFDKVTEILNNGGKLR